MIFPILHTCKRIAYVWVTITGLKTIGGVYPHAIRRNNEWCVKLSFIRYTGFRSVRKNRQLHSWLLCKTTLQPSILFQTPPYILIVSTYDIYVHRAIIWNTVWWFQNTIAEHRSRYSGNRCMLICLLDYINRCHSLAEWFLWGNT